MSKPLALRLLEARKAAGLTQQQLADHLGTTSGAVIRWEGGKHVPSPKHQKAMEELYGLLAGALSPLDPEDEEIRLLREVLETVERLLELQLRRASSRAGGAGGSVGRVAREPVCSPQW